MELSDLSGYETRLIYVHLSELILGLIFFFIFRHFGMVYRRLFLLHLVLQLDSLCHLHD